MLRPIFRQRRKGVAPLKAARTIEGVIMPDDLHVILAYLTQNGGKAYAYGGYLRDLLCLGSNARSGDIDIAMSMADFLALKFAEEDIRKHFVLHEPHLMFMTHQMMDGVFEANPRPLVIKLRPEVQEAWGISHPIGVNLFRDEIKLGELLSDHDFGINALAYDGKTLICHPQFERDFIDKRMTIMRIKEPRDAGRIDVRFAKFKISGYHDWDMNVPFRYRKVMLPETPS